MKPTMFGAPLHLELVHLEQRKLEGSDCTWSLPLCWHAEILERCGPDDANDDDLWWLSVDHGALDPDDVRATTDPAGVDCRHCLEWMHA